MLTCHTACTDSATTPSRLSVFLSFVFKRSSLTKSWIQDLLADTQTLRGYFQKLICIDEVQALL